MTPIQRMQQRAVRSASLAIARSVAPHLSAAERREIRERLRGLRAFETVFGVLAEVARPELARHALHALGAWADRGASRNDLIGIITALACFDPRAALFVCVAFAERALGRTERGAESALFSVLGVAKERALYVASLESARRAAYRARKIMRETLAPYRPARAVVRCADWSKERVVTSESAGRRGRTIVDSCAVGERGEDRARELASVAREALALWALVPQSIEQLHRPGRRSDAPCSMRIAGPPDVRIP